MGDVFKYRKRREKSEKRNCINVRNESGITRGWWDIHSKTSSGPRF